MISQLTSADGQAYNLPRVLIVGRDRAGCPSSTWLLRTRVDSMIEIQASQFRQVIDGRPSDRYQGTVSEPHGNVPSGHMPW